MSDLIKRSDAIKAVSKVDDYDDGIGFEVRSHCLVELELVPSADRPKGEWIKFDEARDYCSRCKLIFTTRTITKQDKWTTYVDDLGFNYCPNCGRDMRGADDE